MPSSRSFLLALLLVAASGQAAEPLARLPLESYRNRLAARVEVAGKPRLFQFDTAGGLSSVSPALADEIGCKPWGALTGLHMTGAKISTPRCDGVKLDWHGTALEVPTAGIAEMGSKESPLDGLLALDAFAGKIITLDSASRELIVESPASAAQRVASAIAVPAHLAREIGGRALSVFIDVPAAHGTLRMELDSGNGGTILVSRPLLGELGLPDKGDEAQDASFPIAPGLEAKGRIFSPELVIDGNLGMPFLKDWIVTLDLDQGRAWFKRNPVRPPAGMGVPPAPKK